MNKKSIPVQVGKRVKLSSATLAFGPPYPSWEDVPPELLAKATSACDTTLFDDEAGFLEKTKDMSQVELIAYTRSLIPLESLPSLHRWAWVFFPCDNFSGFSYVSVER